MADEQVRKVQQWLNATYADINISEDGYTGQGTVGALIKALQHEMIKLGASITADGDFGKGSYNAYRTYIGSIAQGGANANLNYIVQGGCWCKGYNPGGFDGVFGDGTADAIREFQGDAGLAADGAVSAVLMKALLNTDGFKKDNYGESSIVSVQKLLNAKYSGTYGPDIGLVPTNGIYDRKTSKAMLYGVQIEGGVGADGVWGNGTKGCLPDLAMGSANPGFVTLLQCALTLNRCYSMPISSVYNIMVRSAVNKFQGQMALPKTGNADKATWCALLVSCGDRDRSTIACDCATKITPAYAKTLVDNGYQIVGRYLTGTYRAAGGVLKSKALDAQELKTIFDAGLKVFPIFETGGYEASYFSKKQGEIDAGIAMNAARALGFGKQMVVYFAVDCDATDAEIDRYIIPYFQGIFDRYYTIGAPFGTGIYGTRNVCTRVSNAKNQTVDASLVSNAFIADMSTGWSGNMGFVIPSNWAFDQYDTVTIGSGDAAIEIDKDGYSGLNKGVSAFDPPLEMTEQKMREYNARMIFLNETFQPMPFFRHLPASLTANVPVTLIDLGLLKVEFLFSETAELKEDIPVGETGQFQDGMKVKSNCTYTISNGALTNTSLAAQLETAAIEAGLSASEKDGMLTTIMEVGAGMGNGALKVEFLREGLTHKVALKYTVTSQEVPVSGGGTVTISAGLKYTFYLSADKMPPDAELTPAEVDVMVDACETQLALAPIALVAAVGLTGVSLYGIAATISAASGIVSLSAVLKAIIKILKQIIWIAPKIPVPIK